jgi:lipopolysaccharide export system permease protein
MVNSDEGSRIILFDGNRQEVDILTHQLSVLYFDRYTFDIEPSQGTPEERFREPRERTLPELFDARHDTEMSPRDRGRYLVEGHKRITQPFSAVAYALIALACLISGAFSRRSQTKRIVLAVVLMVAAQASAMGIEGLAVKRHYLSALLYLHMFVPIVIGYWVVVRAPRRRRREAVQPS